MSGLLSGLTGLLSLRSGPQDLPPAWPLTLGLIAAYLAASMTSGQQLGDESAAAKSLGVTALQFTAVAILLYWRRYPERLVQTLGALAGVGLVFALISWVLLAQVDEAVNQPVLALTWFAVFVWSLLVDAHIYRHAMSITLPQGILVAVLLLAATYVLIEFYALMGP